MCSSSCNVCLTLLSLRWIFDKSRSAYVQVSVFVVVFQPRLEVTLKLVNLSIIKRRKHPLTVSSYYTCVKPATNTGQR
jgi:hypothetical protein